MNTPAQLETLSTALDAFLRAEAADSCGDSLNHVRAVIRTTNVLLDACIDCGMPHDFADHTAWAAERVTRWLLAA